MAGDQRIGMFDLADLRPEWSGKRAAFLEAPLRRGLELLRAALSEADCLLIELQTEFDFDSHVERITRLLPYRSEGEVEGRVDELAEFARQAALKANPHWQLLEQHVHVANRLPFTGADTRQCFPDQLPSFALGKPELYEKLYVRYYRLDRADGDLLHQLLSFDGLRQPVIGAVAVVGGYTPFGRVSDDGERG